MHIYVHVYAQIYIYDPNANYTNSEGGGALYFTRSVKYA
jgi:hypothetical protein